QISNKNDLSVPAFNTINLNGVISNGTPVGGFSVNTQVLFGAAGSNNSNSLATINVNGNNTFNGGARLFRANVVLGSDTAFGTGSLQWGGGAASGAMGFNLFSTDDARTIINATTMQRNLTIKGDHSLTFSDNGVTTQIFTQSNASNLFNLLI